MCEVVFGRNEIYLQRNYLNSLYNKSFEPCRSKLMYFGVKTKFLQDFLGYHTSEVGKTRSDFPIPIPRYRDTLQSGCPKSQRDIATSTLGIAIPLSGLAKYPGGSNIPPRNMKSTRSQPTPTPLLEHDQRKFISKEAEMANHLSMNAVLTWHILSTMKFEDLALAVILVVLEFYSNLKVAESYRVYIRNQVVNISPEEIYEYYDIPFYENDDID
ncbi:hypothetical protein J1N35_019183 [Gossypium stocksii]|uniref:Uncharacterized protein n=1 Tax=Gossypium stocksii TaxID=47602 RepID=A0A9D3VQG3_9ROSI|nr:hypothetical protein J1N35_019183 [Gossypium stocksii]